MSARWTVLLVAICAGLAALYWWSGRHAADTQRQVFEARRLFEMDADAVTSLGIERTGEPPVEAQRADGLWSITQPHNHIPANSAAWDRIASALMTMTNERTIESQLDDASVYGLDAPSLRVFIGAGGSVQQIDFGRLDPTQAYRYARTAQLGLFLTPAAVYEELNKPLLSLRDRTVFRAASEGFSRLAYRAEANAGRPEPIDLEFERLATGGWRMTKPIEAVASRKKLDALSAELQLLQGRNYVDAPESLADYGLSKPFARITADAGDGVLQTLHLGWIDDSEESAGLFAQREGEIPVFVVDAGFIASLPESVDDMRESRLFTREASQLKAFTYRDAERTLRLEIDSEGAWRLTDPPADDTDQLAVSAYIAVLKQLEAQSFPESTGARDARITLDFEFSEGEPTSQILIGGAVPDADPAELYAWSDNGTLLTLPAQAWLLLAAEPFKFRDKRMFHYDWRDAEAVDLTFEGTVYRFQLHEDRWRVVAPEGFFFETQDDARALLEALSGVTALAIVTPHGGNEIHGLDAPLIDAEVFTRSETGELQSAGRARVGNIATEQGRHRFARSAGRDAIVVVDQGFVDDLRSALEGVMAR